MGHLIKANHPCVICGSRDARAIYHDGDYCFSCKDTIVVVEDIISAIKVGRAYPTLCLFGCSMNKLFLARLKKLVGGWSTPLHLTIWLDQDKLGEAMKIGQQATLTGFDVSIVQTVQDPKYHDVSRIRAVIQEVSES